MVRQGTRIRRLVIGLIFTSLSIGLNAAAQQQPPNEWRGVERNLGRPGTLLPGDVYKVSFPRSDLKVIVKGVEVKPALALISWVAFKKMGDDMMMMGDLVLTEDEVSFVMFKLQQGGIDQSALHNHVLGESPRIMYMHITATGRAGGIAETLGAVLKLTGTPMGAPAAGASSPELGIDTKQLDQILGIAGKATGGVYQFSVPRLDKITDSGMEVPPAMGVATAINFQPTGGGKAAITGDFVLTGREVNEVLRTLRANQIEVTAIHSHMLSEEPRLFFMHFWATDDAVKLARGLRDALDKTNVAKVPEK